MIVAAARGKDDSDFTWTPLLGTAGWSLPKVEQAQLPNALELRRLLTAPTP